ncbi:hypothetical protein [Flavobacterium gelatinilyticum]|uniref:hypothetical protein n=1 Tax=Flavobacterium gelatinilyticum TaxID=3003260 RepID=UPI0024811B53|nr:hypothetical protein [Flavobacterium gelatinilyticum]
MKNILTLILLFLLTVVFTNAQSQNMTLQKLLDNKLLEKKEAKDFTNFLNQIEEKNTTSYLYGLFQCEYKKLTGHTYSEVFSSNIVIESLKLSVEEQKNINVLLSDYLIKLKKSELIDAKQFELFQQKINNNQYTYQLEFIKDITFQALREDYIAPDKLKKSAYKLKDNKIITLKYQSLITRIEEGVVKSPIDLLKYCDNTVIIDTKNYSDQPEEYLEIIHKQTSEILPELAFTNFDFKVVLDDKISDEDNKFYDFLVSIESGKKIYKQKSFYNLHTPSKDKNSRIGIDSQQYYKIFNKILADLHSPYRLHEVKIYGQDEDKAFGIMALTKEQEKASHESETYFFVSYEDFNSKPTSIQIDNTIDEFIKIGFFANLTTAQINEGKQKVAEQDNSNFNEILNAFPNKIYWYDTELGNLEDPYAELLKEFSQLSSNEFNPTDISNKFDLQKRKTTLKFKLGNKFYSKVFKINNDWIDVDFFDFVKSVVTENKLKGQFYELYTGGQDAKVVYLTQKQYDHIKTNKLLLFADKEWEEK